MFGKTFEDDIIDGVEKGPAVIMAKGEGVKCIGLNWRKKFQLSEQSLKPEKQFF